MIKFKKTFIVPTTDFQKWESMELEVRLNLNAGEINEQIPEYSITLPDFIFNELADTEPQFATKHDINNHNVSGYFSKKSLQRKFQKTQTSMHIGILTDYVHNLTQHILDKHCIEKATEKKKIFIYFNHQTHHESNDIGAYLGEAIKQSFRYFIGYEVMTEKFSRLLMGDEKRVPTRQYISKTMYKSPYSLGQGFTQSITESEKLFLLLANGDGMAQYEGKYSIIDWTQEREDFCAKVKLKFIQVNTELSSFLKNLDNNKLDALIASSNHLALNPINPTR